ncbi:MAG: DMT family transporter [Acidobacteriaceae bacterium]|nr:DMT family transporter [Acidobacteriaceae bacterium]
MTMAAVAAPERQKTIGYFFLLALASLIWSGQGIAVKFLDPHLGPIAITFLPFYVTTILLLPLLVMLRRKNSGSSAPTLKDWGQFAIAGICGQMLAQLGMTWGISRSLASNGAILNLLIPVISAVLASVMLREKLTLLRTASLGIGLVGVAFLSVGDLRQASFGSMRFLTGNLLIFGGCLGSSFYNVYCKGLMQRFQEIEILIFSYITASLASVPLLIWAEPFHFAMLRQLDAKAIAAFLFLALLMYGASMLLFFKALQHLDVTTASTSLYLVPVFGVVLAATLLGERVNLITLAGAAIVLASTLLVVRYDTSY